MVVRVVVVGGGDYIFIASAVVVDSILISSSYVMSLYLFIKTLILYIIRVLPI